MNKADIAEFLAGRIGMNRTMANDAVDGVFEAAGEALANDDKVRIAGFGTLGTRKRLARTGQNPRTGESVEIRHRRHRRSSHTRQSETPRTMDACYDLYGIVIQQRSVA